MGKGTVVAAVRDLFPHVWVSVSATTRAPRPGERDGVEYQFVDRAEFARMVAADELLEHAEYAGNLYGTPRQPVAAHVATGDLALLEIDLQGARQVRAALDDALLVFLAPPSWDELERRLIGRGTEQSEDISTRLEQARVEMAAETEFDEVIVNADVHRAAGELVSLMYAACR